MLDILNDLIWSKLLIVMLIGLGLYFTVASRFVQFRYFSSMFRIFGEAFKRQPGQLSSFQALMLSVAGRVGAGNIAGVSVAIMLGGPGAIFWMWVVALVGMATSYFECSLAQLYKRREPDGTYRGGPAFYIQHGLGQRWLGVVVSILLLVTFGFGFNAVQSFTVASSLHDTFGLPTIVSGLILTGVIGVIIFGGIKRIASMADVLVPIMAFSYIGMALVVIGMNVSEVPATLALIVKSAFGLEPAFAGGIGAAILMGVKRGLFSNEAGSGSAPCAAAAAECDDPVKMGFVQALGVLIDTVVICSCTAFLMLLVPQEITEGLAGMDLLQTALQYHLGGFGVVFIAATLALFSFSTFLGVLYYARGNVAYLCGDNWWSQTVYKLIALAMLVIGGMQAYTVVWDLGDVGIGLMTIFNMLALYPLSGEALTALREYEAKKKLK